MSKQTTTENQSLLNREQQHHCIVETARIRIVDFKSVAFSVTKPIIPLLVRRKCNGKHHQSICFKPTDGKGDQSKNGESKEGSKKNDEDKRKEQLKNEQTNHDNEPSGSVQATTTTTGQQRSSVLLQTATAYAYNSVNSKKVMIRILFDSGSQRSYITNELKQKLDLKSEKRETLHLNTFGNDGFKKQNCEMFSFNLQGKNSEIDIEISALAFPVICSPVTTTIDVQAYPHLDGLQLADNSDIENQSIDMLLGADYYYKIITGEIVNGDNGPTAVASKLGWLLLGPTSNTSSSYALSNLVIDGRKKTLLEENENDELVRSLKRFWDLESLGIVESEKVPESDIVQDITFNGKRYEVGLPWNNDETAPLSNDYELSLNRLNSLINRLKKDPNLFREYNAIIEEQIKEGIVEQVPENEKEIDNAHFIPHHGVIRNDRDTTKLRIVFDGSAKQEKDGSSLNDHLLNGPNFIPPIFDVLVKFRSYAVGLTADIEKAFLQIEVKKADRDKLRFLWIQDPKSSKPEVQQLRFCRLVFGLKPSPSILGGTVLHHLSKYQETDPKIVEVLKELYVDDLPTGASNEDTAFEIYKKSKEIMRQGGFNLRKWKSNSKELSHKINQCELSSETVNDERNQLKLNQDETKVSQDNQTYVKSMIGPQLSDDNKTKILGVNWDVETDNLYYEFDEIQHYARMLPPTKRTVLRLVAKIFDPLGLLSAFTVKLKMMFQDICKHKVNWDDELQGSVRTRFRNSKPVEHQLHGFSDASGKAFASAVYLRTKYDDNRIDVNLVASKSRVSPTKKQTIPRLELLGATILTRLMETISSTLRSTLGTPKRFYWVDSSAVLCWIKNNKSWKQYVQNRVQEIRKLSSKESWKYCPGSMNPADLPSRGVSGKELNSNELWWNGPDFLNRSEEEWPREPSACESTDSIAMSEVTKFSPTVIHSLTNQATQSKPDISKIIECQRFSTKGRLIRTTAYVLRIIRVLKRRVSAQENTSEGLKKGKSAELTAAELRQAEELWVRAVQQFSFKDELDFLLSNKTAVAPTYVTQFGLYIDEQSLIRCAGRIRNAPLSESSKNPILLPKKHYFTDLVIQEVHSRIGHSGINLTLSSLRDQYWVIRGREVVKKNVRRCFFCKRMEGRPYSPQIRPQLPNFRVDDAPPFVHTGLDFLGPLYVLERKDSNAEESMKKTYVCLYTCASTRAVHLELTPDLTVPAFLRSFRRFTSRFGVPITLISDNAKTFKSASREVKNIVRSSEVQCHLSNRGVDWKFIVERAPWWGGFWERMVKVVKRVLKKVIGSSKLTYDELYTILTEVETIVNDRPITYIYDDEESISYALSPSQLIYGRRLASTPNSAHFESVSTCKSLTRRAKHHRRILEQFISRWRREYLLSLRENSQNLANSRNIAKIEVGDVVVMMNEKTKQQFWKLAKVVELLPGQDGIVRAARIKLATSEGKPTILQRSIQQLVPLEVTERLEIKQTEDKNVESNPATKQVSSPDKQTKHPQMVSSRPRREAAKASEALRREFVRQNLV
ncbi:uncharacterized protein LOC114523939 [Dendronephthya gigantea]|uniref:uncharacterized protein LOC114523939 n=1 Tax=Dendronephthya gigantea TaxID=151771 RepID=UPI00106BEE2F|nr:uncharacterized protein LOC114523939 [Dendronephthya gigantea]